MALSNIFREPRREITETAIGAAIPAAILFGLYVWGSHEWAAGDRLCPVGCEDGSRAAYLAAFMTLFGVLGAMALLVAGLVLVGLHTLGETICGRLANVGLDPRPRRRR